MLNDRITRRSLIAAIAGLALFASPMASANDKYPEQNIRFVIPFGAGGGSDILARTIGSVIHDLKLIPVDIIYENIPGSSGARGYRDAAKRKGDPYTLATVSSSFYSTPLLSVAPFGMEDFSPVAAIAMSPYIMVVRPDSKIQSIEDIGKAGRLTTGSVGVVSDARLLAAMVSKDMGIQVDTVPFVGEGEILTGVLGGHLDFMFGNLGEVLPQVQAGTLRAVAVSTDQRLPALPDIPSFKEKGHDVGFVMLRGIMLPADAPDYAIRYWEDVLKKVAESDLWKERYLDRFQDQPRYEPSEVFAVSMKQTIEGYKTVLKDLDIIK